MDERITIDVDLGHDRVQLTQTGDSIAALDLAKTLVRAARQQPPEPPDACGRGLSALNDGHQGGCRV